MTPLVAHIQEKNWASICASGELGSAMALASCVYVKPTKSIDTGSVAGVAGGAYGGRAPPDSNGVCVTDGVASAVPERLACAPGDSAAVGDSEPKAVGVLVALAPMDIEAVRVKVALDDADTPDGVGVAVGDALVDAEHVTDTVVLGV